MKIGKIIFGIGFILIGIFVCLGFVRLILHSQLDDVSPGISCEGKLLDWADVYFVIPKFEGVEIEKEWCEKILERKKDIGLHGVYHTYEEFGIYRGKEYFGEGVEIFERCFGFTPERFKPGQLEFTKKNNWIKRKMEVDLFWNQVFHKVYHCEDTGVFPNWLTRIF